MLEPGDHLLQSTQLMRPIDHFDLRSFDLNLLIAFDALMEERSVTRAAARLRVRQPAMSHSLSVLRMLLQDELFVRDVAIMRPTARALNIAPAVRSDLRQLEEILRLQDRLDPSWQDRTFRPGRFRSVREFRSCVSDTPGWPPRVLSRGAFTE